MIDKAQIDHDENEMQFTLTSITSSYKLLWEISVFLNKFTVFAGIQTTNISF